MDSLNPYRRDAGDAAGEAPRSRDEAYRSAVETLGPALARLAAAHEAEPAERQDLLQEIHLQVWRSLDRFDGRCSLRTWVYRVAQNVAVDHVIRDRRRRSRFDQDTGQAERIADGGQGPEQEALRRLTLESMMAEIRRLPPADRQVMLLYLEDEDAATIAEVTGLSPPAVATRIHRIKTRLAQRFNGRKSR